MKILKANLTKKQLYTIFIKKKLPSYPKIFLALITPKVAHYIWMTTLL